MTLNAALRAGAALSGLSVACVAGVADAGAWTQPKGKGQVIVKAERMTADEAFDPSGGRVPLSIDRQDQSIGVFVEYGLTERLTAQVKGDWQRGKDQFFDYEGRGPLELSLVWQAWRSEAAAFSVQATYAQSGDGRNVGYDAPGVGEDDWEFRASAGRSFGPRVTGSLLSGGGFAELQVARRFREGLPDEVRVDATMGAHVDRRWMVLAQAFGGAVDADRGVDGARWLAVETSVVRNLGPWSVQAGWRETVAGRETARASGFVLGLWRRF